VLALCLLAVASDPAADADQDPSRVPQDLARLLPTAHPALPADLSEMWLAPRASGSMSSEAGALSRFAEGVRLYREGGDSKALPLVSDRAVASTALAGYSTYYTGLVHLRLSRFEEARRAFREVLDQKPAGYLAEAAALAEAEAAQEADDHGAAVSTLERLAARKHAPDTTWYRLGRAALKAGDRRKAADAFMKVYYGSPLSESAEMAGQELDALIDVTSAATYTLDLGRAQVLFGARRYTEAREAFQALQREASGDDRELIDLRLAQSDYYLKRYRAAREALEPYLTKGSRQDEARFFHLSAVRGQGSHDEYISRVRAFVDEFPTSPWAEEALNGLGTHHILANDDAKAAEAFRELYAKFPAGSRAERAAWKVGWWEYKNGRHAETARVFESAAATFPRSDYRPAFLYWSGRSREHQKQEDLARERYRLVATDYFNSYYGRLAVKRLGGAETKALTPVRAAARDEEGYEAAPAPGMPPNEEVIRLLLAAGLYDDAINELQYAQRTWGTTSALEASLAWIEHKRGDLRRAITLMRRAYPQFLAAGGEALPEPILKVIFPLDYWESIQRHANARGLDPYLVAALIAQESTFDPGIRSAANAWGLMQVVPSTGRRIARTIGIRRFSTRMLTDPEVNLRIGTTYLAGLVRRFGGLHYALASYNAGESRVVVWKGERPGLEQDEFIDDIPFPETQNYVKRILGTAEDYRTLYSSK
jgi:soluble lytic murein transglycosylase